MIIALCVVLGLVLAYLAACVYAAQKTGAILYTTPKEYAPTPEQVRASTAAYYPVDFDDYDAWEKEEIAVANGSHTIYGEYHPVDDPRGIVILAHGFAQDRHVMVPFAKLFREMGFATLLFDQRRFGKSKAPHGGFGWFEQQDTAAVTDYVRKRFGEDTRIVLMGCSMGAMSVLGSSLFTREADAVIADSPLDRAVHILKPFYSQTFPKLPNPILVPVVSLQSRRIGCDILKNDPVKAAAAAKGPILVLHGESDSTVPVECGRAIGKVLKHPLSRLVTFPGKNHCLCITDTERYTRVVREFLDEVFAAE